MPVLRTNHYYSLTVLSLYKPDLFQMPESSEESLASEELESLARLNVASNKVKTSGCWPAKCTLNTNDKLTEMLNQTLRKKKHLFYVLGISG